MLIKKDWGAIDLIHNTEEVIHKVVRLKMDGTKPPELDTTKIDDSTIEMKYTSKRKLCSLMKGIAKGVGNMYDGTIETEDVNCMLSGDRPVKSFSPRSKSKSQDIIPLNS